MRQEPNYAYPRRRYACHWAELSRAFSPLILRSLLIVHCSAKAPAFVVLKARLLSCKPIPFITPNHPITYNLFFFVFNELRRIGDPIHCIFLFVIGSFKEDNLYRLPSLSFNFIEITFPSLVTYPSCFAGLPYHKVYGGMF